MNRPLSMPLIVDGGWLLHQCNFESGESFENISYKIVRFTANLGTAGKKITVVFDGYGSSPKDHDHGRRSKSYSSNLLLTNSTPCTMTRARFLANPHNKTELIKLLKEKMLTNGIRVVVAADDADTLIVKQALVEARNGDVEVRAEDTDVLCMIIHHLTLTSNDIHFTTKTGSYSTRSIRNALPAEELTVLLLAHSFSGFDMASSTLGFGKVRVLRKMASDKAPADALETLNSLRSRQDDIGKAGIKMMQYLYGRTEFPLHEMRYQKYSQSVAKGKLSPQKLPPTEGAAVQHSLRAYLQWHDWTLLASQSLPPTDYEWARVGMWLEPIGTMDEIAPASLLNLTTCNCRTDLTEAACRNDICPCRKLGTPCLPACGNCQGLYCSNAGDLMDGQESDDAEDGLDDEE